MCIDTKKTFGIVLTPEQEERVTLFEQVCDEELPDMDPQTRRDAIFVFIKTHIHHENVFPWLEKSLEAGLR